MSSQGLQGWAWQGAQGQQGGLSRVGYPMWPGCVGQRPVGGCLIRMPEPSSASPRDSYWVMEGLLLSEMSETVKGMLQNFLDLVQT